MNAMWWNCHGLGSPETVRQLSRLVKAYNPQLLFLSETKLLEKEAENLKWRLQYECGVFVACSGVGRMRSGGLMLLWHRSVAVNLLSFSKNHIDVSISGMINWRFTGFYGWPETGERHRSWELLLELKHQSPLPWLCGGDFNEILYNSEKRGGQLVNHSRRSAFLQAIRGCGFEEVRQSGLHFTWTNGQENDAHIESKLDRVCPFCNSEAESLFHLFAACPVTIKIWEDQGVELLPQTPHSFTEFITELFDNGDSLTRAFRATCLWGIWKIRNLHVFKEDRRIDIPAEMTRALTYLKDFQVANIKVPTSTQRATQHWTPPPHGWFKANSDAGIYDHSTGQIGVIIRDSGGQVLACYARRIPHVVHPTILEAHGVRIAMEFAASCGLNHVIFESDCQPVIHQLIQNKPDLSDLSLIIADCVTAAGNFLECRYSFIRREGNGAAHALTKVQLPANSLSLLFSSTPDELLSIVEAERM